MNRPGFTLLETLLAVTLTAAVGIAALALTNLQAHVSATARAQERSLALVTETARLLDDDLLQATAQGYGRFEITEGGALHLVTGCRLPGDAAGLADVEWRFDAANGRVLRTATPMAGGDAAVRVIGDGWRRFAITLDHDVLWLDGRAGEADVPWHLPLWTEGR